MSEIKENEGVDKRLNKSMAFPIINQATVAGVLMGDPPLRQTRRGVPVTNFVIKTMPEESGITPPEGWEREPCYVSVVMWAQQAVNCNRYLKKGSPVLIIGELQSMPNATPENGFYPVQINAQWIQYLDRGENATSMEDEAEAATASSGEDKK